MTEKKKILIIDDEKDMCELVKANLESTEKYEVTMAYSGGEGIAKAREENFDLVITDFNMPDMNGEAVLDAVREMSPGIPVLVFTIYYDDRSKIAPSLIEKASGLVGKPMKANELRETIENILG